jgi:hypothetical protein
MFILRCGETVYRLPTNYWKKLKVSLNNLCLTHIKKLQKEWSEHDPENRKEDIKVANEFIKTVTSPNFEGVIGEFEDFLIKIDLYGIFHLTEKQDTNSIYSIGNAYDIYILFKVLSEYKTKSCIIYDELTNFFENSFKTGLKIYIQ